MENGQPPVTSQTSIQEGDVVMVASTRVMCEGSGGALGHPRTFLDMGSDTSVTCKYCDRVFKLDPSAGAGGHH